MTKLQQLQDQLTKFTNDEDAKKWIQDLLDSTTSDIDRWFLSELLESYKKDLKKLSK